MEANEQKILAILRQGQRDIRRAVDLLMERYEVDIYNYCLRLYDNDHTQSQKLTEQVFRDAPRELVKYEGNALNTPLYNLAFKIWESQIGSLLLDKIDNDEEEGQAAISGIDRAIIYLRTRTPPVTWKEIGSILNMLPNTAQKRLERIKERRGYK